VGQSGPILGPLHDGGPVLLRQQVYDGGVTVLGRNVDRGAIWGRLGGIYVYLSEFGTCVFVFVQKKLNELGEICFLFLS